MQTHSRVSLHTLDDNAVLVLVLVLVPPGNREVRSGAEALVEVHLRYTGGA